MESIGNLFLQVFAFIALVALGFACYRAACGERRKYEGYTRLSDLPQETQDAILGVGAATELRGEDPAGLITPVEPSQSEHDEDAMGVGATTEIRHPVLLEDLDKGLKFRAYIREQSEHDREAVLERFRDSQE